MPAKKNDLVETFSARLRAAREAAGLRQVDVANLAGLSEEPYARLERGVALPRLETFFALVKALNVKGEYFIDDQPGGAAPPSPDGSGVVPAPPSEESPESADFRRLLRAARKLDAREVNLVAQLAEVLGKNRRNSEDE